MRLVGYSSPKGLRITVRCEECGRAHLLENGIRSAGDRVYLICHDCETPLRAVMPDRIGAAKVTS